MFTLAFSKFERLFPLKTCHIRIKIVTYYTSVFDVPGKKVYPSLTIKVRCTRQIAGGFCCVVKIQKTMRICSKITLNSERVNNLKLMLSKGTFRGQVYCDLKYFTVTVAKELCFL